MFSVARRVSAARPWSVALTGALLATMVAVAAPVNAGNNPLRITKTASPSPVASGQQLTYTILVENTGGARLDEVVLTDIVNDMTGVDGTDNLVLTSTVGTCTQTGNLVECAAGTLEGFQSWTVTIRGVVTAANGTVLNNTASVSGTKSAQTHSASDTVSVIVQSGGSGDRPDLSVSINPPSQTPHDSDYLTTFTVNNTGGANATDVAMTATLDPDAAFKSLSATSLFTCTHAPDPAGTVITCEGGAVNAGANATIHVYATAPNVDTTLTTTARVDPFDTIDEIDELNNDWQATTQVTDAPPPSTLAITKTDTPDPIAPWDQITYDITITNTADRRADYLTMTDGTQGLEASSIQVTTNLGSCTVSAPTVTCEHTRFYPGEVWNIQITGTVIASAGSSIINTATITGNIRNKGVTNTAHTVTTVRPRVDLTVTQYRTLPVPPEPVRAADRFDYTITVGNSGLYDASNVVVRQPLPAGVTQKQGVVFDGFSASVPLTSCGVNASNVVTCIIPTVPGANSSGMPQGTTETITLFLIAPHAIGPITTTVTVDPANNIAESDESNNTFQTTTDVQTGVDLTVEKVDNLDPIARNGTLRYTITVPNQGTQDTTDVVVRDTMPAGTVFRSAQGDHNFTCSASGQTVECTGGVIRGTYSGSLTQAVDVATITIDAFSPDEPGIIHNEVRVDPDGAIAEIEEGDNIAFEDTVVENGILAGVYKELDIPDVSDNFDPVATSGTLDYTLTVRNRGTADAFNVVVEATLPTGAVFRSANDTAAGPGEFVCTESGGVVTCSGGTVAQASGTRAIKIRTFAPPSPGTALLEAIVDPSNAIGEADEANNEADETTVVDAIAGSFHGQYHELHVFAITDNHDPVAPDGTLDYTVTVANTGSADAFGVSFRAALPPGSRYRAADDLGTEPDGFSCTHADGVVTCTGARINSGASRQVKISVFAPSAPGTYRLDVVVDPDNTVPEGHEGNNAAEEFTGVQLGGGGGFIDLAITKTQTSANPMTPGGEITYQLTVDNVGTDDAFNVAVRDPLPEGTQYVGAATDGGFVCQHSNGVVDCTGGHVPGTNNGGADRVITLRVKAPLAHDIEITNQAFVDPSNAIAEADETNNSDTVMTVIQSQIDLTVTNTPGSISSGSSGSWSFSLTKSGAPTASNVVVVTELPVGVIPQNVTPASGWTCQIEENPINKVTCTIPSLTSTSAQSFTVDVFTTADSGTTVTSTTIADPNNTIVEIHEDNNVAQGTTNA